MNSDSSPLQGKLAAGLIKVKDQGSDHDLNWTRSRVLFKNLTFWSSSQKQTDQWLKINWPVIFLDLFFFYFSLFSLLLSLLVLSENSLFFFCLQNVGNRWKRDLSTSDVLCLSVQLRDPRRRSMHSQQAASPISESAAVFSFTWRKFQSFHVLVTWQLKKQSKQAACDCHMPLLKNLGKQTGA